MRVKGHCGEERRVFAGRRLVVWMAMIAVAVTLAGRTIHLPQTDVTSVQANAVSAKVQHRSMDGVRWSPPVQAVFVLRPSTSFHIVVSRDELLPSAFVDFGLYTRPPPAPEKSI